MAIGPIGGGPTGIPPNNGSSFNRSTEKTEFQPHVKVSLSKEAQNLVVEENFWDVEGIKDWDLDIISEKYIKDSDIIRDIFVKDPRSTPLYEKTIIKNNFDGNLSIYSQINKSNQA
jgi:hypothetical protein